MSLPAAEVPSTTAPEAVPQAALDNQAVSLRQLLGEDLARFTFLHQQVGVDVQPGQRWLAAVSKSESSSGGGWAILGSDETQAIGLIIYHAVDLQRQVAIISYALELDARGRGIGTRAVGLAVDRLLNAIGFDTLFADVDLANVASRRLLHKVGFDPLTPGVTPGVEIAPDRPAQRWRIGKARPSVGSSIINLGAVGPL